MPWVGLTAWSQPACSLIAEHCVSSEPAINYAAQGSMHRQPTRQLLPSFSMSFALGLLGGAAIQSDGRVVTGRAAHKRRIAILALLACGRGRLIAREKLIGYLWAEHPTDAARHLLSESLYVLRKELGENSFVI